jgi:hypothetical protein
MPDKVLYEYAVLRVVPRVEREEFVNVGVILFSKQIGYLACSINHQPLRVSQLFPSADLEYICSYLLSFERICMGLPNSGPIALLPPAERFRWLTAVRSTVVQTSRLHPGFCSNPALALQMLYDEYVL